MELASIYSTRAYLTGATNGTIHSYGGQGNIALAFNPTSTNDQSQQGQTTVNAINATTNDGPPGPIRTYVHNTTHPSANLRPFEPLLSTIEAGELLNIHPVTLLRWAREGRIPHFRIGRRVLFSTLRHSSRNFATLFAPSSYWHPSLDCDEESCSG